MSEYWRSGTHQTTALAKEAGLELGIKESTCSERQNGNSPQIFMQQVMQFR